MVSFNFHLALPLITDDRCTNSASEIDMKVLSCLYPIDEFQLFVDAVLLSVEFIFYP
jgi:hypothetical protein